VAKQAFLLGVGGTLRQTVPEGVPASGATVTVYKPSSTTAIVDGASATISGRELSYALTADHCATEATNYRARWTYTVAGETLYFDTLFDVSRAILRPPCGEAELLAQYPILTGRYPKGQSSFDPQLADAWDDITNRIRATGKDPNRIISSEAFRRAHATLAAALVADNFSPGSAATREWPATAQEWAQRGADMLEQLLAAPWWYDATSDLVPDASEESADLTVTLAVR
jgi:hypothetical protein